ncbi:hypothetical protein ES703_26345 [subsurface metagenome]
MDSINFIQLGKGREFIKILDQAHSLLASADSNRFFHFIGESFYAEPYNFMTTKIYSKYRKRIEKLYHKQSSQLITLESYIIKTFSLMEEEQLIDAFIGSIRTGNYSLRGRLYLTNLRIIGHGLHVTVNSDGNTTYQRTVGINHKKQRIMVDAILEYMHRRTEPRPCFGYQFPIMGVMNINRKGKRLIYRCNLDFKSSINGKNKSRTYKFTITPKRVRKEENKWDFYTRLEHNLDITQKVLLDINQLYGQQD